MSIEWIIVIIVAAILAFGVGYYLASRAHHFKIKRLGSRQLPADYYTGLNYLINEKPDNAIDAFINLLKVDSDTIETHLALGNLFRRQGEVERAIRIHQNLIARPELSAEYKKIALYALAQDYLKAGVLDRAEKIFLSLVSQKSHMLDSAKALLRIYQQEKEWHNAIEFAQKIQAISDRDLKQAISHFNCELAQQKIDQGDFDGARSFIKQARNSDKHNVRIALLQARIATKEKNYAQAIKYYKEAAKLDQAIFLEAIPDLAQCYRQLNSEQELIDYLNFLYAKQPSAQLLVALSHAMLQEQGLSAAINQMGEEVGQFASLTSLQDYLDLSAKQATLENKARLQSALQAVQRLTIGEARYRCQDCGYAGKQFYWSCPSCLHWGTIKPIVVTKHGGT